MQDAKIKREARRRKILENSEKRLQKITRLKYGDDETVPEYLTSASSFDDASLTQDVRNYDDSNRDNTNFANTELPENHPVHTDTLSENAHNFSPSSPLVRTATTKLDNTKIWQKLGFKLVILAFIVRIVHIFRLGYLFGETVVIPFSLFMMTQLGSCQFDQNISGITGPVLLFIGVSPNKIKNLLICYNVVTSILICFGIYFFTFVLVHLICVIIFGL